MAGLEAQRRDNCTLVNGMAARLLAIFPLFAWCAWAQFFSLATTGDGSQLYFATPLRQKNSTQPDYGKLFRIDASGLRLQKELPYQPLPPVPLGGCLLGNAYDLQFADVSTDAQTIAATARREIGFEDEGACAKQNTMYVTTVTTAGQSHDYLDKMRLSANGAWAFGGTGTPLYSTVYGYLVNLSTGEQTVVGPGQPPLSSLPYLTGVQRFQVASSGRPVANDGTAVFSDIESLAVIQGGQIRRISLSNHNQPSDAVIDASARKIVYAETAALTSGGGGISLTPNVSLRVADVTTGDIAVLSPDGYAPSLSDDGSTVLYLSKRDGSAQAWLIHTDGSGDRELTHDPIGIQRAILSGDGSTAYAVTLNGQLLRITAASGDTEELIPRTPYLDPNQVTAPGKLVMLTGEGLADFALSATLPLPYTLDNIQVTIQGEPARIFSVAPTSLAVLTPPDLMAPVYPNTASIRLNAASPSPFAAPVVSLQIWANDPQFLEGIPLYPLAAHEDWSELVTPDAPAHPGEVLHAYATGLGPTSPTVPYGVPAPAQEPLARVATPYRCFMGQEVPVFFEGLAPNLTGIYQIDWRVPVDAPAGEPAIICQMGSMIGSFPSFSGRIPVAP